MKPLAAAGVGSAVTTLVAAWSLRAADTSTAVLALAATTAVVAWLTSFHGTRDASGLALAGSAHLVGLTLVGRFTAGGALPVLAAQVVGAVAAGGAVLAADLSGGALIWDEPALVPAAVLGLLVGVVTAWTVLAADAAAPWWSAATVPVSAALLGVGLAAAAQPAALLGLAVAGVVGWSVALVVAAAVLVGTALGTFVVSWVSPHEA